MTVDLSVAPMAMTERLKEIFKRYGVKLRKENTSVTHLTYGTKTELTPQQFAVYEACIKSVYIAHQAHSPSFDLHAMIYYQRICDDSKIKLPYIAKKAMNMGKQAVEDYHHCKGLIQQAGLYYDLLD